LGRWWSAWRVPAMQPLALLVDLLVLLIESRTEPVVAAGTYEEERGHE
jgi:hypothetical protein